MAYINFRYLASVFWNHFPPAAITETLYQLLPILCSIILLSPSLQVATPAHLNTASGGGFQYKTNLISLSVLNSTTDSPCKAQVL